MDRNGENRIITRAQNFNQLCCYSGSFLYSNQVSSFTLRNLGFDIIEKKY